MPATSMTYRRQPINGITVGENAAIAGLTGYRYQVHGLKLVPGAAGATFIIKDGTTALTGAIVAVAGIPYEHEVQDNAYYETSSGNAFVISVSAGALSGAVWYRQL